MLKLFGFQLVTHPIASLYVFPVESIIIKHFRLHCWHCTSEQVDSKCPPQEFTAVIIQLPSLFFQPQKFAALPSSIIAVSMATYHPLKTHRLSPQFKMGHWLPLGLLGERCVCVCVSMCFKLEQTNQQINVWVNTNTRAPLCLLDYEFQGANIHNAPDLSLYVRHFLIFDVAPVIRHSHWCFSE